MFLRAALRGLNRKRLAGEIAAQLALFVNYFDRLPDFVDGHQHVHLFPQVREAVLEVVKEAAPEAWVRQCGRALPLTERFADRKALVLDMLSRRFRARAAAYGIATNPAFAGTYDFMSAGEENFAQLFPQFLRQLPANSVVMCHPGFVDAELERLDPLTHQREREYAFLVDDGFPDLLRLHGIVLA
jgi:predicted glycoside hydrolase/deacetylase ChbG (UPF0249 family)